MSLHDRGGVTTTASVASVRRALQNRLNGHKIGAGELALRTSPSPGIPNKPKGGQNMFAQNDVNFTDKKWVWVPDNKEGYIAGYIINEEAGSDVVNVRLVNGRETTININDTEKVNPPKFDRVDDMADLGYLNEASVVHNLKQRFFDDLIYTYSGLFLVAVNPYYPLPIYGREYISGYKNKKRNEVPPHIFAITDAAYHDMLHSRDNQSILVTGESGAGKTENTKKVIQYLTALAGERPKRPGFSSSSSSSSNNNNLTAMGTSLDQQILSTNPILESFGNAQTIRNNNSSRFGKFIRIEFNMAGQIAGAHIEWYLLEKPRVIHQSKLERNYHVFYQFMKGASNEMKSKLLIDNGPDGYAFTKQGKKTIRGVDDEAEFKLLVSALTTTGFTPDEQFNLFRIIAAILHLGNIQVQSTRLDEAMLKEHITPEKVCHVLGIQVNDFTKALLRPSIRAGRDWVTQSRSAEQVVYSIEALSRALYERLFGALITRINHALGRPDGKSTFIGVLDIAGFEILEVNTFEQLCINYTNERLQQFFNHHMFILEQEEYKREGIEWNFIDFGLDLQPTIDLIDKTNPIGILSCLDEECVMPKATDKTFTEKLHNLWGGKSSKYEVPRFATGFVIHHYASRVEYNTTGWLEKNKDPLNESITRLLAYSTEPFVAQLFDDYATDDSAPSASTGGRSKKMGTSVNSRVVTSLKRGAFRTVSQRHKDHLNSLMAQLNQTQPHFVRCILPNSEKKAGVIDTPLVLEQLRCNGVLEGIRITRQGFPNRLPFSEFRQRYEILSPDVIPRETFVDSKRAVQLLLEAFKMDPSKYRLGNTKVFFRAGVLAELEEVRDVKLSRILTDVQAIARGALCRARFQRRIDQAKAIRVIQRNARIYNQLCQWSWWRLYRKIKPLLNVTRTDEAMKKKDEEIKALSEKYAKNLADHEELLRERDELFQTKEQIEHILISERSAAVDQEEILKRTQEREMALEESLKEHASELERLDEQCEQLTKEKKRLETELAQLQKRLETEAGSMRSLADEREAKSVQLQALEKELSIQKDRSKLLVSEKDEVEKKAEMLADQLAKEKTRTTQAETQAAQLQAAIASLEEEIQLAKSESSKHSAKHSDLELELKAAAQQIEQANKQVTQLQSALEKAEAQLAERSSAHEATEGERRELALRVTALEQEISNHLEERKRLSEHALRLEKEVDEMRGLMEKRADEGTRESELRRMREEELKNLREELNKTLGALEQAKQAQIDTEEAMRSELEKFRHDNGVLQQARDELAAALCDIEAQFEAHKQQHSELEVAKRDLERELNETTTKSREVDTMFANIKSNKEVAEKELAELRAMSAKKDETIEKLTSEKSQLEQMVQQLQSNNSQASTERSEMASELEELRARMADAEAIMNEYQAKITQQAQEYDELKELYQEDVGKHTRQLEQAREEALAELRDLRDGYDELEARHAATEKAKSRAISEIEDLKHQLEQQQAYVLQLEHSTNDVDGQLAAMRAQLDEVGQQRQYAEEAARASQAEAERLQAALGERDQQLKDMHDQKEGLESELKTLINEIGDGTRNVHDLEKEKVGLEQQLAELQAVLAKEQEEHTKTREIKRRWEDQRDTFRQKLEEEMNEKERQFEEGRRLLLQEVNTLGEKLDQEAADRERLMAEKAQLEQQVQELRDSIDQSQQSRGLADEEKRELEDKIRQLEVEVESQIAALRDHEALAARYQKKSNSLQDLTEQREREIEALGRINRNLERRLEEVLAEAAYHLENRNKLDAKCKELEHMVRDLQETVTETDRRSRNLELTHSQNSEELEFYKTKVKKDMEGRLVQLEESQHALSAALRVAQQELEDKQAELMNLDRSYGDQQQELMQLRKTLEEAYKAKEAIEAEFVRYRNQHEELSLQHDAHIARSNELEDAYNELQQRFSELSAGHDNAEYNRSQAEKKAAHAEQALEDARTELQEALRAQEGAENRAKELEASILELQAQIDEYDLTKAEVEHIRDRLQEELNSVSSRHQQDVQEHDEAMERLRQKYQKELEELTEELGAAKNDHLSLREAYILLDSALAQKSQEVDKAQAQASKAKNDLQLAMSKLEELAPAYEKARDRAKEVEEELTRMQQELEDARSELSDAAISRDEARAAKRKLESRLEDLQAKYNEASRSRQIAERAALQLEDELKLVKAKLSESTHKSSTASDRANKLDSVVNDALSALEKEREANTLLTKERNQLEKQVKGLKLQVVDLESALVAAQARESKRFVPLDDQLSTRIKAEAKAAKDQQQTIKRMERQLRELQYQASEREKAKQRFEMEAQRLSQKVKRLESQLAENERVEHELALAKRRVDREYEEKKELASRLQRELDTLRSRLTVA